jgi:hypothetical protein
MFYHPSLMPGVHFAGKQPGASGQEQPGLPTASSERVNAMSEWQEPEGRTLSLAKIQAVVEDMQRWQDSLEAGQNHSVDAQIAHAKRQVRKIEDWMIAKVNAATDKYSQRSKALKAALKESLPVYEAELAALPPADRNNPQLTAYRTNIQTRIDKIKQAVGLEKAYGSLAGGGAYRVTPSGRSK